MITKVCAMCKKSLALSALYQKKGKNLYHSYCKKCSVKRVGVYYESNRSEVLGRVKSRYQKNKEVKREKYRIWSWNLKIETLSKYGGKCVCCGEAEPKFLAIDHIENNGNKHRKEIGNVKIYSWIKRNNYPSIFQVLCHNCNMAKAFWKVCPHKANELKEEAERL